MSQSPILYVNPQNYFHVKQSALKRKHAHTTCFPRKGKSVITDPLSLIWHYRRAKEKERRNPLPWCLEPSFYARLTMASMISCTVDCTAESGTRKTVLRWLKISLLGSSAGFDLLGTRPYHGKHCLSSSSIPQIPASNSRAWLSDFTRSKVTRAASLSK